MNNNDRTARMELCGKALDELRDDVSKTQKSGLPFITASVIIWTLIFIVCSLNLNINLRNILVFCCSCPLLPIAVAAGRIFKVDIFEKKNPLGNLGIIFTMNQMIYLLIAMWVFRAMPEKMVMVYAMIFGAHLLPYSWLYKSRMYIVSSVLLPIGALVLEHMFSAQVLALVFAAYELLFTVILYVSHRKTVSE